MKTNKVVLYIAMSLDGYIAKQDGTVDWLFDVEGDGEDNGYSEFYKKIGTVVMGRNTYQEVLTLAVKFPYANNPTYVLSRSEQPPAPHVIFTDEQPDTLIPRLKQKSVGDVWIVGGGKLVQAILEYQLLDEIQIAIIPKILGEGIPLFPNGTTPSTLRLMKIETLGQIVSVSYQVTRQ